MIRVLHIANARMGSGGTETFMMNMYRNIDRKKIQFDFVVFSEEEGMYEDEIKSLGGMIYKVSRKQDGLFKNMKQIYDIVHKNNYKIVHRHSGSAIMIIDLIVCKMAGAKHLIAHAQNAYDVHKIIHYICRPILNIIVKNRFACSDSAGKWMYRNCKYTLVPSVVDVELYNYDIQTRMRARQELNIDNEFVIGNIAVFKPEKNHLFLIDVFNEIHKKCSDAKLLLVGDGEMYEAAKSKVMNLKLDNCVIFTGQRSDIERLYNAMDVFCLPSLFEGFPMTLVEAQTEGLPCVISDKITKEVSIVPDVVSYVDIDNGIDMCADEILKVYRKYKEKDYIRTGHADEVIAAGFSAYETAKKFENLYLKLSER